MPDATGAGRGNVPTWLRKDAEIAAKSAVEFAVEKSPHGLPTLNWTSLSRWFRACDAMDAYRRSSMELTPSHESICATEGREAFVRDNAPSLLAERDAKIERQRVRIQRLEQRLRDVRTESGRRAARAEAAERALQQIRDEVDHVGKDHDFWYCNDIARAALEPPAPPEGRES